jgi:hypothetical protein
MTLDADDLLVAAHADAGDPPSSHAAFERVGKAGAVFS